MNLVFGQILLWAGFLSGALATVFSTAVTSRLEFFADDVHKVVVTAEIAEDSDAWQKGLRTDDQLVSLGDKTLRTPADLAEALQTLSESDGNLVFRRADDDNGIAVTADFKVPVKQAVESVRVKALGEQSVAAEKGLRDDDQLISLAGKDIKKSSDLKKILGTIEADETTALVFRRDGQNQEISLTPPSPWQTINWLWYGLSAAACVVGIVILRSGMKSKSVKSEQTESSLKEIKGHLSDLVANIRRLHDEHKNQTPRQTLHYIDHVLADDFGAFADGRDNISREYGLEVFAEVMTEFAAGERAINRAWSASADGYVEEAATCIDRGLGRLQAAEAALKAASE